MDPLIERIISRLNSALLTEAADRIHNKGLKLGKIHLIILGQFSLLADDELNKKLAEHGLLKIKISGTKDTQESFLKEITEKANCELVGAVGSVAILFRVGVKPISAKHLK